MTKVNAFGSACRMIFRVRQDRQRPRDFQAKSSSGTFRSRVQRLIRRGVTQAGAVARPEMPPGAMSFGMVNIAREVCKE